MMATLREMVEARAGDCCEFCGLPAWTQAAQFHLDHVVPQCQGGDHGVENRAYTCPHCNLHKSDAMEGTDSLTQTVVALFNPRTDIWSTHFCSSERNPYEFEGQTPTGRATIAQLQLNHPRLLTVRRMLAQLEISIFSK